MTFDLPVAEERVKPHQVTALHLLSALIFIGCGAVVFRISNSLQWTGLTLLIFGLAILSVILVNNKWLVRAANNYFRLLELVCSVLFLVLALTQKWWLPVGIASVLSVVLLLAFMWERQAGKPLLIKVDDQGIHLPVMSLKSFLDWSEIERILVRFGTLTIDCYDNRFFQLSLKDFSLDERQFTSFCEARIDEGKSRRRNDEW